MNPEDARLLLAAGLGMCALLPLLLRRPTASEPRPSRKPDLDLTDDTPRDLALKLILDEGGYATNYIQAERDGVAPAL